MTSLQQLALGLGRMRGDALELARDMLTSARSGSPVERAAMLEQLGHLLLSAAGLSWEEVGMGRIEVDAGLGPVAHGDAVRWELWWGWGIRGRHEALPLTPEQGAAALAAVDVSAAADHDAGGQRLLHALGEGAESWLEELADERGRSVAEVAALLHQALAADGRAWAQRAGGERVSR